MNSKRKSNIFKPSNKFIRTALIVTAVYVVGVVTIHNNGNYSKMVVAQDNGVYYNTYKEDETNVMPVANMVNNQIMTADTQREEEIQILALSTGDINKQIGLSAGNRLGETDIKDDGEIRINESEELLAELEHEKIAEIEAVQKKAEADLKEKEKREKEKDSVSVDKVVTIEEQKKQSEKIEKEEKGKKAEKAESGASGAKYVYKGLSEKQKQDIKNCVDQGAKDSSYSGQPIELTGYERSLLECLVFGEAGDQGFAGQVLVAQTVHDEMIKSGVYKTSYIIKAYAYSGSTRKGTTDSCKDAVSYVFDDGGYAVQHRIMYFYAPGMCKSSFHESQNFVIEWKGHRVFDEW